MALVLHGMAVRDGLLVIRVALAKARLSEAIKVLLIMFVRILEGMLDALDKHVADSMKSLLDVIIKFPGRL